ncbi:hypothetical protein CEW92_06770 [Bacillaceae bacterium SAS-127]|nr:hypothetical protein CEW92_06770 [Bacillaceae bacterium SAS-127]
METYLLKYKELDVLSLIENTIERNGGFIVYSSPVFPIMGVSINKETKIEIEETFDLEYIIKDPDGQLQNLDGTITSTKKNHLQIVPSLNFQELRNSNYVGWTTTVAVLDSGINESWVSEHTDLTGYGSTAVFDHGTKVANIIKAAAPGARILSYKVCQHEKVKGTAVLSAIDQAVTKADIINLSIGFDVDCKPDHLCPFCEYVNYYTQNSGKLFVVAAGNKGKEDSIQCPGKSQEAITVAAIKPYSQALADYSSRGVPGIKKPNILTSGTIYFNQVMDEGTSFSTPAITGVCASFFPYVSKNVSEMKSRLYSSAIDIGLPEHHQGFGLLDLEKLLEVFKNDQSDDQSKGQKQN